MFSSIQGEGGSVRGSCQGRRQIFIRFAGCNLAGERRPCLWCDSPKAQDAKCNDALVEKAPGGRDFETVKNPIQIEEVLRFIKRLETPDLHSLSITGGEPLNQPKFLEELCVESTNRIYLETNGTIPKVARKIAEHVDFASADIKDESAIPYGNWRKVVKDELECIRILRDGGAQVFAKVVVTNNTESQNISWFARELKELEVPLAIQPVTTEKVVEKVSLERLFRFMEAAAQYLSGDEITLSLQTHRFYGIL
jgi:organic radical activating enzyme